MKKVLLMLLSVLLCVGLLAGCGSKEEEKGEFNLYTWDGMFPPEVLEGFEKETGYKINFSHFDYDEDMLAKLEETEGGDYSVIIIVSVVVVIAIAVVVILMLKKKGNK